MTEPTISINGHILTNSQAMAVRVAVTSFQASLSDPNTWIDDEHGIAMTKAYRERLSEVMHFLLPKEDQK